jgi:DNA helicase-2/ATP-dependent DNA helicase PcrA
MMATIEVLQHGEGIGQATAKEIFEALVLLGDGSVIDGLLRPNKDIKNPFAQKKQNNQQLGLFDEFVELGSIGKFKRLGFDEKFFSNSILKHPTLQPNGAVFLYEFYNILHELGRIKNPTTAISHITKSRFFMIFKDRLCQTRAKLKDGSIDDGLLKTAMFKLNRKVDILKQLSYHHNDMFRFVNSMVLGASEFDRGSGVSLMSIHASKGLEFEEVYIIDLMDGRFPNKTLISKGGSIEEERRLFYVAVTRAKDILYLCYAKYDRIKKQDFVASRFLKEAGMCK